MACQRAVYRGDQVEGFFPTHSYSPNIMLGASSDDPVLNPDTYLNHLSPADAFAFEIEHDVLMVILGVRNYVPKSW
jgi:hypothetical protein